MNRRIVVNADDFGLHPAINAGIVRAHREGIVTSASLMPTGEAFEEAVRLSQSLPSLDLGLHFALVGIANSPPTWGKFLLSYASRRISSIAIAAELRRQLDIALTTSSLTLSHIDSHQHLHAIPGIMRVVCNVAAEYGIPGIRLPLDDPPFARIPPARRAQAALLRVCAHLSRRYIAAHGLKTTDHFSGMAVSGHLTTAILAEYIRHAQPGTTEIICHPGADNSKLAQVFEWGYDWEGELAAVCGVEVKEEIVAAQGELISWRVHLSEPTSLPRNPPPRFAGVLPKREDSE